MIELRCPGCRAANAVADETPLGRVRCASCAGDLRDAPTVGYVVEAEAPARPRRDLQALRVAVARGRLSRDSWISEDGGPSFLAGEKPELFAAAPPQAVGSVGTGRRRSLVPAQPPEAVQVVIWLNRLLGVGLVVLGVVAMITLGGYGYAMLGFLPVVLSLVPFALASGLRDASRGALGAQMTFSVLGALLVLLGLLGTDGEGLLWWLIALAFATAPLFLLGGAEGRAFFRRRRSV